MSYIIYALSQGFAFLGLILQLPSIICYELSNFLIEVGGFNNEPTDTAGDE